MISKLVTHRAICNQVQWRQSNFPLSKEDAVLQRTPLSFDPSVWEFLGPLSAGARLVLPRPGAEKDDLSLAITISKFRITSLQLNPGLLGAEAMMKHNRCPPEIFPVTWLLT